MAQNCKTMLACKTNGKTTSKNVLFGTMMRDKSMKIAFLAKIL
jgi:hypothetical protein